MGLLKGVECMLRTHGSVDKSKVWPIFNPFPSLSFSLCDPHTVAKIIHWNLQELPLNTVEVHYVDPW